jgi:predicted nucleic acid-binding Zn ribbon protein
MEQLFGSLSAVVKGLEANPKKDEAIVFAAWRNCAGEMLSKRTKPLTFSEKRLVVAVEDKIWQRHLEHLSPQMLAKLNKALGEGTVTFIEFRVDKDAEART